MAVAHRAKLAIIEKFGGKITIDNVALKSFPEARVLASVDKSELVRLIKNERKCEYLLSAATAFSSVEEKWLREAPVRRRVFLADEHQGNRRMVS